MSLRRYSYPLKTYSSDSDSEGVLYPPAPQFPPIWRYLHRLFLNFIFYVLAVLVPAVLILLVIYLLRNIFVSPDRSDCHCSLNQYNYAPQRHQRGGRYGDSKKGRTVDSYFCPHCGNRHRPSLRVCPSPTCAKPLTLKARCGNCHLPREDSGYLFCRYCGLAYAEVGLVRPVQPQEESTQQR